MKSVSRAEKVLPHCADKLTDDEFCSLHSIYVMHAAIISDSYKEAKFLCFMQSYKSLTFLHMSVTLDENTLTYYCHIERKVSIPPNFQKNGKKVNFSS